MKSNRHPDYLTAPRERLSYWVYFVGQNLFYAIVAYYLVTYMMMIGVDVTKTAAVMFAVKFWDAVNDALFGLVFDKVRFKKGKCMPWIRISTALLPVTTVLLFIIPRSAGETVKLAWFAIAYVLYDTAYTICDVPVYSLVTTMTDNMHERNTLMSFGRVFSGLGGGLAMVLCTVLVSESVGLSYGVISVIIAVLGAVTMVPLCRNGRERGNTGIEEESFTLRQMMRYLGQNKYLLLFYSAYIIANSLATSQAMGLFVSYYLFGNSLFNLLLNAIGAVPALVIALFIPKILQRVDKYVFYMVCTVVQIVLGFIIFAVGYRNIIAFMVLTVIRSIPASATGTMAFMFTPDCAEYGKFKTGTDAKGITFAIQTFSAKIGSAVSQSLGLMIVGWFGWQTVNASSFSELEALNITQPASALEGLWITYALVPVIGSLLSLIPLFFYRLRDRDVRVMAKCNFGEITHEEAEKQLSRPY